MWLIIKLQEALVERGNLSRESEGHLGKYQSSNILYDKKLTFFPLAAPQVIYFLGQEDPYLR